MGEEVVLLKNDTVSGIERLIADVKHWQAKGGRANPRETAFVITKLEEARLWAFLMVNQIDADKQK